MTFHFPESARARRAGFVVFGIIVGLLGLAMLAGGAWLIALGGSWYYAIAGLALLISGILLARLRPAGAWLFAAVFVGTLAWTAWERGANYWAYVPRVALLLALALLLAALCASASEARARRTLWGTSAALLIAFVGAFALAFVPHGVTRARQAASQPDRSLAPAAANS